MQKDFSISYAILAYDECGELSELCNFLDSKRDKENSEIVILQDEKAGEKIIEKNKEIAESFGASFYIRLLDNFSNQKNHLNSLCKKSWIFNIDADERPSDTLFDVIPSLISMNDEVELFQIPRINIVIGYTEEDRFKYGWMIDERGFINFPDYQSRLYKNIAELQWKGNVHETIQGYKSYAILPPEETYCILHIKSIEKQRQQNKYYETFN